MQAPVLHPTRRLVADSPWHHGSAVESLVVDATGSRFLAAGRFLAQVRLVDSGEVICALEGVGTALVPRGPVVFDTTGRLALGFCVPEDAWSAIPDFRRRGDAPLDGVLATWDARTGTRVREIPCRASRLLAWSSDRAAAIVTDAESVVRWNLETALPSGRIENADPVDTRVRLFTESGVLLGARAMLSRWQIPADGPARRSFRELVDFDSGAFLRRTETRSPESFAGTGGESLVAATRLEVTVLAGHDLDTVVARVPGAVGIAPSPDGRRFACWANAPPVRIYETASGNTLATLATDGRAALSPDGRIVVARGFTGRLSVHAADGAQISGVDEVHAISGLRTLVDDMGGTLVASREDDASPLCFDAETLDRAERLLPPPDEGKTSPDGRWRLQAVVASGGWRVHRTDLRTGETTREPGDSLRVVNHVAFAPDGDRVVSGTFLSHLVLWRISTFEILGNLKTDVSNGSLHGLSWSPDDRWIVSGDSYGAIVAWDLASGRDVVVRARDERSITAVSAGPRGLLAFAARDERHATLWSLDSGRVVGRLEGHTAPVTGIAFTPDARHVVTGGLDGRVLAFSMP